MPMHPLTPHTRWVARVELLEQANANYAGAPQYVGKFDAWVLMLIPRALAYKGGDLPFCITIGEVQADGTASVLNPTNKHVCVVPVGHFILI